MSKRKKKKRKTKLQKVRDWLAVSAWFMKSGPMRNKKKSIKKQRRWRYKDE